MEDEKKEEDEGEDGDGDRSVSYLDRNNIHQEDTHFYNSHIVCLFVPGYENNNGCDDFSEHRRPLGFCCLNVEKRERFYCGVLRLGICFNC